jgi:hypothetical protein
MKTITILNPLPELPRELWVRIFFYAKMMREIEIRRELLQSAEFMNCCSCVSFQVPIFMFKVASAHAHPFHNNHPFEKCLLYIFGKAYEFAIGMWNNVDQLIYLIPPKDFLLLRMLRKQTTYDKLFSNKLVKIVKILKDDVWYDCKMLANF